MDNQEGVFKLDILNNMNRSIPNVLEKAKHLLGLKAITKIASILSVTENAVKKWSGNGASKRTMSEKDKLRLEQALGLFPAELELPCPTDKKYHDCFVLDRIEYGGQALFIKIFVRSLGSIIVIKKEKNQVYVPQDWNGITEVRDYQSLQGIQWVNIQSIEDNEEDL